MIKKVLLCFLIIVLVVFVGFVLLINSYQNTKTRGKDDAAYSQQYGIHSSDAKNIVKALPEVVEYAAMLESAGRTMQVRTQDAGTTWLVQVYELLDGHTATFKWFNVDKTTGGVSEAM